MNTGSGGRERFLLQEHQELWTFVRKITDERNGWLKFYWGIITASLAALGFFLSREFDEKSAKFWIIATAIFFALMIVSIAISMILFSLRKKSIEYRNHLNRIRGAFLSNDDPKLSGYLHITPDQKFFKRRNGKKNWFGVENSILWLVAAVSSLICGAFVFSLVRVITICGITLLDHRYCIPAIAFIVALIISLWLTCRHSRKFDKKIEKEFATWQKAND